MNVHRSARSVWVLAAAAAVVVGALVFLLGWAAVWATPANKDRAAAVNATRQTFLAATAGLVAIAGLVTGVRTFRLSREGQRTDRYARAVALIASDKPAERIGGVFALERLLAESERDHDTIIEVLTAFVRQYAPAMANPTQPSADRHVVQAAMTVIGRRPLRVEANDLSLARTDLRGLTLVDARLSHADLRGCRMEGANLTLADCRDALITGTDLADSRLVGTDLRDADLRTSILHGADFEGARLDRTDLRGALLGGVADRPDVQSLTKPQLDSATTDQNTKLPEPLRLAGRTNRVQ